MAFDKFFVPFLIILFFFPDEGAQAAVSQKPSKIATAEFKVKIATVDTNKIIQSSKAATEINDFIEKRRKKYHEDMVKGEQNLRLLHKQLQENQQNLSQQEFSTKRQQFETKLFETQRLLQSHRQELDTLHAKTNPIIEQKIRDIIEEICRKKGVDIVFPNSVILYGSDKFDISDEIIQALNQQLPSVDIEALLGEEQKLDKIEGG